MTDIPIEEIRQILTFDSLDFPEGVTVVRVEVEPQSDWQGEESLKVLLILDDATEVPLPKRWVLRASYAINEKLAELGYDLYAYIWITTEAELAESVDE